MFKIWEIIPDLVINWKPAPYPVVDDNAVRAWAWLMFILWLIALVFSLTTHTPALAIIIVPIITLDLLNVVLVFGLSPLNKGASCTISNTTLTATNKEIYLFEKIEWFVQSVTFSGNENSWI